MVVGDEHSFNGCHVLNVHDFIEKSQAVCEMRKQNIKSLKCLVFPIFSVLKVRSPHRVK